MVTKYIHFLQNISCRILRWSTPDLGETIDSMGQSSKRPLDSPVTPNSRSEERMSCCPWTPSRAIGNKDMVNGTLNSVDSRSRLQSARKACANRGRNG